MRELLTEEIVILRILSKRWNIGLYELYNKEVLSVAQIAQFVTIYEKKGYIICLLGHIIKTFKGNEYIKSIQNELYRMASNSWKDVPEEYKKKPFPKNEPFIHSSFKDVLKK